MSGNIIVTGGAGYIGSHVCKGLAKAGFHPVTYDNLSTGNDWAVRWGPLEIGDLLDSARLHEVCKAYRPIAVMHFAASALVGESMREPARYYRNNVTGTLTLLDACRAHDIDSIVFSSSCAVYGIPDELPITEQAPKAPVNPYGASKLAAERVIADYAAAYGLRHATLRYFNAAGADIEGEIGEHRTVETHLIPLALDAVLGLRSPLQIMGTDYSTSDGTAVRDYVHVTDLTSAHVAALKLLLEGSRSFTANLGTGKGYSVREILTSIENVTGRTVPHSIAPRRPGDPPMLIAEPGPWTSRLKNDSWYGIRTIIESAWQWHSGMRLDLSRLRN